MGAKHLIWIAAAVVVSFLTSWVFGDLLTLPVDLYYLIYFSIITVFLVLYSRKTGLDVKGLVARNLLWGICLGLAGGVVLMLNVLSRPETERLSGGYLAWTVFWRGLVYGSIDGLLLSTFPWIVTWRAFAVEKRPLAKQFVFGLLAWAMILVITTGYHLGYSDFRSRKVLLANVGNTLMSLPTLLSSNPVGSPITHATMHITAVLHSPKTDLFIPPHRE